jgi:hypothetical protein
VVRVDAGRPRDAGAPDATVQSQIALSFHGPYDTVEVAHSTLLDVPADYALEAWLFVRSYEGGHGIFNRWQNGVGDIELSFGVPEPLNPEQLPIEPTVPFHDLLTWGFFQPNTWRTIVAPTQPGLRRWTHIAVSYGGGLLKLYVDGQRISELASSEPFDNPVGSVFIGATARDQQPIVPAMGRLWWPPMDGFISDVRLSSADRYPAPFLPEPHLGSDAQTIALWPLDEAQGDVARDLGPNALNGVISGASWQQVPARLPPQ